VGVEDERSTGERWVGGGEGGERQDFAAEGEERIEMLTPGSNKQALSSGKGYERKELDAPQKMTSCA
jgi:hypothetical protein